jgi:small GTP-binding protein
MEEDSIIRLILVGDSGVGKSSIMFSYCEENFSDNFISTIGVDFRVKNAEIDNRTIKLYIWDTAGQERFRCISKSYFRNANVILLTFDLTNIYSFYNLEKWMDDIEVYSEYNPTVLLVGNKCENYRAIPKSKIEDFVNKYSLEYFEVSAKNNINIEELFQRAIIHGYNRIKNSTSTNTEPKSVHSNQKKCCFT